MRDIVIRSATNADCDRVIDLVSTVLAEFQLPFDPDSKDADLKDIEGSYIQAGGVFELIEDSQGKLVGTYGLFPLSDNAWTSPDYVDTWFRLPHSRSVAHIATDLSNQESNDDADGCTRLRCTQRWPCVQLPAWATRADRATPI